MNLTDNPYSGYYQPLYNALENSPLSAWRELLPTQITDGLNEQRHGDLITWHQAVTALPKVLNASADLGATVTVGQPGEVDTETASQIKTLLAQLIPWRKGPYRIHGTFIDTEWRSDWKWDRLLPHIAPLKNRLVLDVGCGNGYHGWRMLQEGAERVIGIDPSPRFVMQFLAIKHFIGDVPFDVLPVGIEALPPALQAFDSVFSMGVFYHRRSPIDHLRELKETLRSGGELILETLAIEGKPGEVLVPEKRYAMMNNVWFIPSPDTLLCWLRKCGFINPRLVDISKTTTQEQRSTEWMRFHSLSDFLDPDDPSKTVEGHPAPVRAVFLAEAP